MGDPLRRLGIAVLFLFLKLLVLLYSVPAVSFILGGDGLLPLKRLPNGENGNSYAEHPFELVLARDRARHRRLLSNIVDFPVGGVSDPYLAGLYFTIVYLGTPPRPYYVQIDTGSDLLWVNCKSCHSCPGDSGLGINLHFFDDQASSTALAIQCSDSTCESAKQFLRTDCTSNNYCGYTVSYGDQSETLGYYVADVFHYNQYSSDQYTTNTTSAKIIFGCSYSQSGELAKPDRAVDGIFGFGQQGLSVLSQLNSQGLARKVFSHCLKGGEHGGGILVIGEITEPGMVYSPLVESHSSRPHYNLNLQGIAVNGKQLPVDPQVFETGPTSGTIIDSGTTLAYLAEEAYDQFINAILAAVPQSPETTSWNGTPCFLASGSIDTIFPSITLYFEGAAMDLTPQEYLVQRLPSDMSSLWCIGWQKSGSQPNDKFKMTILGDLVLKDKIIVYDLEQRRIGWTRYDCLSTVNVSTATGESKSIDSAKLNSNGGTQFRNYSHMLMSLILCILCFLISQFQ